MGKVRIGLDADLRLDVVVPSAGQVPTVNGSEPRLSFLAADVLKHRAWVGTSSRRGDHFGDRPRNHCLAGLRERHRVVQFAGVQAKRIRKSEQVGDSRRTALAVVEACVGAPSVKKDFPHLVLGMTVDRQNTDAWSTVDTYSVMHHLGYPSGEAAGDRAFFKSQDPNDCQIPMLRLGHRFVRDYQLQQLGIQDHYAGANMVDGQWYCPEMSMALVEAELDFREGKIDEDTYDKRIAARRRFAATRKARPDEQGATRWSHPVDADGKPVCNHERKGAPKFCAQKTVLFPIEAGAKYGQEYALGSPEHKARYKHPRNTIEAANAKAKSDRHGLDRSKRRRMRGQPRHHLLIAVIMAAVNVATILTFYRRKPGLSSQSPTTRSPPSTACTRGVTKRWALTTSRRTWYGVVRRPTP